MKLTRKEKELIETLRELKEASEGDPFYLLVKGIPHSDQYGFSYFHILQVTKGDIQKRTSVGLQVHQLIENMKNAPIQKSRRLLIEYEPKEGVVIEF